MKILFVSLGCDKNLVDSEHMIGALDEAGYSICDDENEADIVVINTCSFIEDAMTESIDTILEYAELKQNGMLKAIIVTGCLAQRYQDEFFEQLPEVDAIIGTNSYDELVNVIHDVLEKKTHISVMKPLTGLPKNAKQFVSTGGHFAYLKIAEGCSKRCTYCVIPKIRGNYRSVPMETILEEAKTLVADGAKELILVAQETTVYGIDLYQKKMLPTLLNKLAEIEGLVWIRILYAYPEEITDELIECIATNPKVCHYIDMPIQHCNDKILKAMGRKTSKSDLLNIIKKLRTAIPDICIRTTLIAGFPGETLDMHHEMMVFAREVMFDRLGVFPYSQEEGSVAAEFENQLDDETKKRWADDIMSQQKIYGIDTLPKYVGKTLPVFIEGYIPQEDVYVGRSYRDTPTVDGYVFVQSPDTELVSGQFVNVKITEFNTYDLIGDYVDEFTK